MSARPESATAGEAAVAPVAATVLLTHARGRLEELAPALRADGHEVVHAPRIVVRPRAEAAAELHALTELPWLLFASRSAVEAWTAAGLGFPPDGPRLGVVGPGTAEAVRRAGGRPELVGRGTARDLAAAFLEHVAESGGRPDDDAASTADAAGPVGLPRGDRSRPDLPDALAAAGVAVRPVTAYATRAAPWRDPGPVDVAVFASPSAVEATPAAWSARVACVAIGPTTADALRARGARPAVAERPDAAGLRSALVTALAAARPAAPKARTA